jgi:hypothetical protein
MTTIERRALVAEVAKLAAEADAVTRADAVEG